MIRGTSGYQKLIFLTLMSVFLFILPAASLAQEVEDSDPPDYCNPVVESLAEALDILCDDLLAFLAEGYELGQVMQAVYVAGDEPSLEKVVELLERKDEDDIGWGQLKLANRLENEDFTAEMLLGLKIDDGLGWGQIKKVQALVDVGADPGEAVEWMQKETDWKDIQDDLGLDDGPPPWANNQKSGEKENNGNGPPDHSNAGGKNKDNGEPEDE